MPWGKRPPRQINISTLEVHSAVRAQTQRVYPAFCQLFNTQGRAATDISASLYNIFHTFQEGAQKLNGHLYNATNYNKIEPNFI